MAGRQNQRLNATITIGGVMSATLGRAVGAVNAELGKIGSGGVVAAQNRIGAAIERNDRRLADARMGIADAVGAYYTLKNAIGAPVRAAMDFESAMADVIKVVDFPTPEALTEFRQGLIDLSREVPQTVDGLAEIAAAAGQSGIAGEDLTRFTESAAKIGVAFDISAGQAGEALAKLITGLGMTIDEAILLSDAMNHLSNNQAATAAEVMDVVRRVGAQGKQFGFTAQEVAAFGSAMVAAGSQTEVAATSFRNMGRALTRGESATKRQAAAYNRLGLEAGEVAKRMQEDAVATTIDVMERIAALPDHIRAAVSSDLFGDEARALGPLLTNLDLVRESVGMVADDTAYAGSAFKEFAVRNNVFASRLMRFQNAMQALKITVGEGLLPALTMMMDKLEPVIDLTARFVAQHPDLASNVMLAAGALIAFRGAVAAIRFVGLLGRGGGLHLLAAGMATVGRAAAHLGGAARNAIALQTALGAMAGGQTLGTLGKLGVGLRAVVLAVPGVGKLAAGISAIGAAVATISAPVWATFAVAAAAVAAVGVTIWRYWDRISSVFGGVAQRIGEELAPAIEFARPVLDWFAGIGDTIGAAWQKAGEAIGSVLEWIGGLFGREVLTDEQKAEWERSGYDAADRVIKGLKEIPAKLAALGGEMFAAGEALITAFWDGMKAVVDRLITWVGEKVDAVLAPFRSAGAAVQGYFQYSDDQVNAWSGNPGGGQYGIYGDRMRRGAANANKVPDPNTDVIAPPVPQGYAVGGAFPRGPIVVGEHGPELRFEDRAGFIATNRQLKGMASAAARIGALGGALAGLPAAAGQFDGIAPVEQSRAALSIDLEDIEAAVTRGVAHMAPAAAPASAAPVSFGDIVIHAAAGQDPRQIADAVLREIERRSRAALFDGDF